MVKTETGTLPKVSSHESVLPDTPWIVLVWDDPINLMSYVTYVLQEVFKYSKEKAEDLMLKVHNEGKAVVSSGKKEEMEVRVKQLQTYGLWATFQKDK